MERLLTEDQRESLRDAMQAQREKMRGLQEQIREARRAMVQAALGDDFNESVVRAKALEVAKLEAEISVLRFKAISEVQPPLSKEQLERFLNPELPQGVAPGVDEERPMNRRATRFRGPAPGDDEMPPRRRPVDE
jgi:Spy/CpxP family protein refolding chaperone